MRKWFYGGCVCKLRGWHVTNGELEVLVNTNESTYIPAGHKHRLENVGVVDLVMIEVQSGEYLGEDDIVRFENHYGRVSCEH